MVEAVVVPRAVEKEKEKEKEKEEKEKEERGAKEVRRASPPSRIRLVETMFHRAQLHGSQGTAMAVALMDIAKLTAPGVTDPVPLEERTVLHRHLLVQHCLHQNRQQLRLLRQHRWPELSGHREKC
jgi:hypothetical protein